jgi:putative endonuclease
MEKRPAIYIMANKRNGTLYTGVTSDLIKRVYQHKNNSIPGFSDRYDCKLLVYYEMHEEMLLQEKNKLKEVRGKRNLH